jgi:alanyl-tRNA synthetase
MVKTGNQTQWQIALETTPFYGESGGQVGDKGTLTANGTTVKVVDTQKENDLILAMVQDPKVENLLQEGLSLQAVVDQQTRKATESNHSATHLLHAALRQTLGTHVTQKGSLVNEQLLRFDFSHFAKTEEESLQRIEDVVNARIRENIPLDEKRNVPIEKAREMGAMALFGEKYGEFVRVITFDPSYSVELCGGTHVPSTGEIGLFKIVSETSVAAGVRRIEALTGHKAFAYMRKQEAMLNQMKELLSHPKDLSKALLMVLDENQQLKKRIEAFENEQKNKLKEQLLTRLSHVDGVNALLAEVKISNADMLRQLAFEVKAETENLAMVLAADVDGKPHIAIMFSENLTTAKQWNAGQMARELGKLIKGGGGGQAFFATAGGSDLGGLSQVLPKAKALLSLA